MSHPPNWQKKWHVESCFAANPHHRLAYRFPHHRRAVPNLGFHFRNGARFDPMMELGFRIRFAVLLTLISNSASLPSGCKGRATKTLDFGGAGAGFRRTQDLAFEHPVGDNLETRRRFRVLESVMPDAGG
jgi:hypothetical protein